MLRAYGLDNAAEAPLEITDMDDGDVVLCNMSLVPGSWAAGIGAYGSGVCVFLLLGDVALCAAVKTLGSNECGALALRLKDACVSAVLRDPPHELVDSLPGDAILVGPYKFDL